MDSVCGLRQPGLVPEDDLVKTRAGFGCQGLLDGGDRLGLRPLCGSQSLANVDTYGIPPVLAIALGPLASGMGHRVGYRGGGAPWQTVPPPGDGV
jgi:hypothetical protein